MVLKKIVVSGFKSFAEKTEVEFDSGVTAIIGPNGCGKSNISDAIRWVLGEHNPRRLRGQAMQDMIFNGTAKRKAAGAAEVSLLFDNTNGVLPVSYREVVITRRLYRSGESEYLLNKTKCRMKDITDLFLDSGIGTNAYSLMEQGRVDMIVNAKPTERRQIIEEAAGVSRFLHRKQEAIRKLERTDQDLTRIDDILTELQRQRRSLERQAKQAELAKRYRKELLDVEYTLHVRSGGNLHEKIEDLTKRSSALKEQITQKENELKEIRERKQVLNARLQEQDDLNRNQRDEYATANARLEQMEQQQKNLSERLGEYAQMRQRLISECEADTQRQQEDQKRIEDAEAQIKTLSTEIEQLEQQSTALQEELDKATKAFSEVEGEEKKRRSHFLQLDKEVADLKNQQRTWERDKDFYSNRLGQLKSQHEELRLEINQHEEKQAQLAEEGGEVEFKLQEARQNHDDLNKRLQELAQEENQTKQAFRNAEKEYQQKNSRLESLSALQAKLEGFDKGVRYLLRDSNEKIPELLCTLAEKIQVSNGYEPAVEAALSHKLQAIVCGQESALKIAIQQLREGKKGRVAFLPPMDGPLKNGADIHASLSQYNRLDECITCDDDMRPLVQRLGHHVFVADTLDNALQARQHLPNGYRLVTLEGDLIESDGSVTGGFSTGSQILGRSKEIQELEQQCQELKLQRQALEEKLHEIETTITSLTSERDTVRETLHEMQNRDRVIKDELGRIQKRLRQYQETDQSLTNECQSLQGDLEEGAAEAEERQLRLEQLVEQQATLESELDSWADQMQSKRDQLKQLQESQSDIRMNLMEKKKDQERWQYDIETVSRHVRELIRGIEEKKVLAEEQEKRKIETENAIEETKVSIEKLREERDGMWQAVHAGEEATQSLKTDFRKIDEEEKNATDKFETLRSEREKLDQDLMKSSVEQEYWQRKMDESFGKIEDKEACEKDERSDEELIEKVEFYRRRLGQLGVVNELAIEEYEEVRHRCEFLEEQQADLLKSKQDLIASAKQLHGTTVKLFLETFEQVQENFNKTFRRMFGGGRAELRLLEGDPLDAGIEIEVQPPGKKLQTIGLLSGGEKALVACALLFAIYEIKPCPFCFLDEIDAPLDDTNIGRFTRMLRDFIEYSQFIIITHSKKTMEMCDSLYGVTMAEEGVSTVYSMQFDKGRVASRGNGANGSNGTNGSNGHNGSNGTQVDHIESSQEESASDSQDDNQTQEDGAEQSEVVSEEVTV